MHGSSLSYYTKSKICYFFLCCRGGDEGDTVQGETDGFVTESEEMEIIDDTLEEKSKKFLLTAKNVRSIVHVCFILLQFLAASFYGVQKLSGIF